MTTFKERKNWVLPEEAEHFLDAEQVTGEDLERAEEAAGLVGRSLRTVYTRRSGKWIIKINLDTIIVKDMPC